MKDIIRCDESYCYSINKCLHVNHGVGGDTCGITELHLVAFRNDVKAAERLLTKDVKINCKNKCGHTPLFIAVQNGNMEMAELLLACGANVNIPDLRGYSPLQVATDANNEDMVDLLIAYCMGG